MVLYFSWSESGPFSSPSCFFQSWVSFSSFPALVTCFLTSVYNPQAADTSSGVPTGELPASLSTLLVPRKKRMQVYKKRAIARGAMVTYRCASDPICTIKPLDGRLFQTGKRFRSKAPCLSATTFSKADCHHEPEQERKALESSVSENASRPARRRKMHSRRRWIVMDGACFLASPQELTSVDQPL
jgi:hypothetical protein